MRTTWTRITLGTALGVLWTSAIVAAQNEQPLSPRQWMQRVAGRYAHYDIVAYVASLPLRPMRSLVVTYGFTDFSVEGDQLIESETFCHASYKSNLPMTTHVNDAFTRAIVPRSTPVSMVFDNHAWTITRPETPTPLGAVLAEGESLPHDPKAVTARDDDQDGRPGVTVDIKVLGLIPAQMYIARRERFAYDLRLQENGVMTGVVRDASEQVVLGASRRWLARQNATVQDADLTKSPILLVPVNPDYDCDRLMQERDALFPPEPPSPR